MSKKMGLLLTVLLSTNVILCTDETVSASREAATIELQSAQQSSNYSDNQKAQEQKEKDAAATLQEAEAVRESQAKEILENADGMKTSKIKKESGFVVPVQYRVEVIAQTTPPQATSDRAQSAHEEKCYYVALELLEHMVFDGSTPAVAVATLSPQGQQDMERVLYYAQQIGDRYLDGLWNAQKACETGLVRRIIKERAELIVDQLKDVSLFGVQELSLWKKAIKEKKLVGASVVVGALGVSAIWSLTKFLGNSVTSTTV